MNLAALLLSAVLHPAQETALSPDQAVREFRQAMRRPGLRDDERVRAIKRLGAVHDPRVVQLLVPLVSRGRMAHRMIATRALAGMHEVPGAGAALLRALRAGGNRGENGRGVRILALRGLGELGDRAAARDVAALIRDSDDWIAKAAIEAAGKIRDASFMDPLIKALRRLEGPVGDSLLEIDPLKGVWEELRIFKAEMFIQPLKQGTTKGEFLMEPIREALRSIARENHETGRQWEDWWRRHRRGFRVPQ